MRILLSSEHLYPAYPKQGVGREPLPFPSGSAFHIHDLIAHGLSRLNHTVFYLLPGARCAPESGVVIVSEPPSDVDICHCLALRDQALERLLESRGIPSVATCHLDPAFDGQAPLSSYPDNWIYVSRSFADWMGSDRWVQNGLDPGDYIFCESKKPYFLFLSGLDYWPDKGLDLAFDLSRRCAFPLKVAGSARNQRRIDEVISLCEEYGAEFLGDVRGYEKAMLLAEAKALLFPTKMNESFGLVLVEAMMSGTPSITSACGACPEVVSPEVGFVCNNLDDYMQAVRRIEEISPHTCRQEALAKFHYQRMARDYVREYEQEIETARDR